MASERETAENATRKIEKITDEELRVPRRFVKPN